MSLLPRLNTFTYKSAPSPLLPASLKYDSAISLLQSSDRTTEKVLALVSLTQNMSFFQEMNRKLINQSERVHERCCAVLKYEFYRAGEVVFFADEKPNKFFILFSGIVNILIPKTETNLKKDIKDSNKRFGSVKPIKILQEFLKNRVLEDENNGPEGTEMSPSKMRSEFAKIGELLGGVNPFELRTEQIEELFVDGVLKFTYYTSLKEGFSFGELGLLRGKARSATVICKEDCHLGVLMAEDYRNILAVVERKKLYNKLEFFKQYLVKGIAYDNLAKLAYAFEKKKLTRSEYLFKEGDVANEVFLIKKGEIQVIFMNFF